LFYKHILREVKGYGYMNVSLSSGCCQWALL